METEDEDATVTLGITIPVDPCKQFMSKEHTGRATESSESDDSPFNSLHFSNLPHFLDPNLGIMQQLLSSDIDHQIGTFNTWNIEPHFLDILPLSNRCFTEDSILIFGGFNPSTVLEKNPPDFDLDDFVLGSTIFQYLLDSGIWNYYGTMIEPRCYHGCALDGHNVYVIGGYSLLQRKYGEMLAIATTDRLNLDNGQWKRCANMITTRASLAVVSHKGFLYAFGGRDSNGNILESVEIYCPEQDTWTEITSLPHPSMGLSAVCVMDAIWLVGGITYDTSADRSKYTFADQSKCLLSSVYLFVPSTRRWYNKDPLPFACAFSSCVLNHDSLWLIGGCTSNESNEGTLVSSSTILKLTLSEEPSKWKKVASLEYPRHALIAFLHDECIYVFAGIESQNKNASGKIEVINTITNVNTEWGNIPVPVAGSTSVLVLENTACRKCNSSFIQNYSEISDLSDRDDYLSESRSLQDSYEENRNIYRPSEPYLKSDLDSESSKEAIFADSKKVEDSISVVHEAIKRTSMEQGSFEDRDKVETQTKLYQHPQNVRYRASMEIFLNSTMSDSNLPEASKRNESAVSKWRNYLHNLRSDEKLHEKVFQSNDSKIIVKTEMSDIDSQENYKCAEVLCFEDKSSDAKCKILNGIISSSMKDSVPSSGQSFMYVQSNMKSEYLNKNSSTTNFTNEQFQASVDDVSTKRSNLEMNKFAISSTDTEKINMPAEAFPIILLMGGLSRPYNQKSRYILSYHCAKNIWKNVGNMPEDRCHHSVLCLNNKLYIIGGFEAKDSRSYEHITRKMLCYDISEEAWHQGPEMKYARAFHSALVIEKEIYVLGGRDQLGNILSSVEIYNVSNNEWRECNSLPYPVLGAAISVVKSALHVFGGIMYEDEDEVISYNTSVFDFMNKSWSLGPEMPMSLAFCGIHSSRNFIWLFGGLKQEELNIISSKDIIKFDADAEDWTKFAELSAPRHASVILSLDTKAYIIGGYSTQEKKEVLTCEMMDITKDEIIVIESLPLAASGRAGVAIKKIF